ncbi:hypothetical protein GS498_21045 [Rhodococcus hoagii]|nr:hypothetical protein [Prescottella equi]
MTAPAARARGRCSARDSLRSRDVETLDRIAGQLPVQGLTAAELDTLAAGGQVGTLPQTVRDYYAELYRAAGKDGVLALGTTCGPRGRW